MAHFAELDDQNVVARVVKVDNEMCLTADGLEDASIGVRYLQDLLGGRWVQTSYNGSIRGRYAGIGYRYRPDHDDFIPPAPFPSWVWVEESKSWTPPKPRPSDEERWFWVEEIQQWANAPLPE